MEDIKDCSNCACNKCDRFISRETKYDCSDCELCSDNNLWKFKECEDNEYKTNCK